ncbi:hypothetical protein JOE44_001195 [Chryseobacterium sp. PvR013]|nr:hypothetical protein [Chryseobacterium sp. PvR013]
MITHIESGLKSAPIDMTVVFSSIFQSPSSFFLLPSSFL